MRSFHTKVGNIIIVFIILVPAFLIILSQALYNNIPEGEAKTINAHYLDHAITGDRSKEILISFSDYDFLWVKWNIGVVADNLDSVDPGAELTIKVHPRCNRIMSITCGCDIICDYNDTLQAMRTERRGFILLGIVMYLILFVLLCISKEGQAVLNKYKKIVKKK